jgi:hypothetical protein
MSEPRPICTKCGKPIKTRVYSGMHYGCYEVPDVDPIQRLIAWMQTSPRQNPSLAFTAGPLREAADWVEVLVGRAKRAVPLTTAEVTEPGWYWQTFPGDIAVVVIPFADVERLIERLKETHAT